MWTSLPQQTVVGGHFSEGTGWKHQWDAAALPRVYKTSTSVEPLRWIHLLLCNCFIYPVSHICCSPAVWSVAFSAMVTVSCKRFGLRCHLLVAIFFKCIWEAQSLFVQADVFQEIQKKLLTVSLHLKALIVWNAWGRMQLIHTGGPNWVHTENEIEDPI